MIRANTQSLIVLLVGFLAGASFLISKSKNYASLLILALLYLVIVAVVVSGRISVNELGLDPTHIRNGVMRALPLLTVIVVVGLVVYFLKPSLLQDVRYKQDLGNMLLMVFVAIPLKTVIIEELIFRGSLLALLQRQFPVFLAVVLSALAFGLWHVFSSQFVGALNIPVMGVDPGLVAGFTVVFATFVAGMIFGWLRIWSGSLITPMLIHWAINSIGVVLAYLAWRYK